MSRTLQTGIVDSETDGGAGVDSLPRNDRPSGQDGSPANESFDRMQPLEDWEHYY